MNCIHRLLELKSNKSYLLINKGIALEHGGEYKGYHYAITINEIGIRCAYVALTPNDPYYEHAKSGMYDAIELEPHGGITYAGEPLIGKNLLKENKCSDIWIGFDAGHCGDAYDYKAAKQAFKDQPELIKRIIEVEKLTRPTQILSGMTIKDATYMETECKKLIDQIIIQKETVRF